jgi:hypothetical protein
MIQLLLYSLIHVLLYICEAAVYQRWAHSVQAGGSSSKTFTEAAVHGACPFGRGASWRRNHRRGGSMEFKVGTLFLKTKTKTPVSQPFNVGPSEQSQHYLSRQWRDSGAQMKQSLGRQKLVRPRDSSVTVTNTVVKGRFGAVLSYRKMIGSAGITFGIETMVHRGRELCDSCCLGPTPNTKL